MLSYYMKCKRCGNMLHEEEVYIDNDDRRIMQIGCYGCSHKGYIALRKWNIFKDRLAEAIERSA